MCLFINVNCTTLGECIMFQMHKLFFKSLADDFVSVLDYKSVHLRVNTFGIKRDTLADFKKTRYFKNA